MVAAVNPKCCPAKIRVPRLKLPNDSCRQVPSLWTSSLSDWRLSRHLGRRRPPCPCRTDQADGKLPPSAVCADRDCNPECVLQLAYHTDVAEAHRSDREAFSSSSSSVPELILKHTRSGLKDCHALTTRKIAIPHFRDETLVRDWEPEQHCIE